MLINARYYFFAPLLKLTVMRGWSRNKTNLAWTKKCTICRTNKILRSLHWLLANRLSDIGKSRDKRLFEALPIPTSFRWLEKWTQYKEIDFPMESFRAREIASRALQAFKGRFSSLLCLNKKPWAMLLNLLETIEAIWSSSMLSNCCKSERRGILMVGDISTIKFEIWTICLILLDSLKRTLRLLK